MYAPGFEREQPTREEFIKILTDRICKKGSIIPLINKEQYNFDIICKGEHYPDDLFTFIRVVSEEIISRIENILTKPCGFDLLEKDGITFNQETPYFDNLTIGFKKTFNEEIGDKYMYGGRYNGCKGLLARKLRNPNIILTIPFNSSNETDTSLIKHVLCHELTHLYDDWVSYTKRGTSLFVGEYREGDIELTNHWFWERDDKTRQILGCLADIIHITSNSERRAYTMSAIEDFYDLGMGEYNCKYIIENSFYYKSLKLAKEHLMRVLNAADDEGVKKLNFALKEKRYRKSISVPREYIREFDVESYRYNLIRWADDRVLHALHKYYSIAWEYATVYRWQYSIDDCHYIREIPYLFY